MRTFARGLVNLFINEAYMGQQERNLRAKELDTQYTVTYRNKPDYAVQHGLYRMLCRALFERRGDRHSHPWTESLLKERLSIYFYVISGGEPFLREDLLEIAEKHSDAVFMVYTNGTLIDEHLARRLAELGNMSPAISIEGMETETDARRGPGTFKAVMAAMDHLREAGAVFGFSATYTRNNVDALIDEAFIDLMIEKGAMYGWFFMFIPVGKDDDMNLMCTPSQRDAMRRHVLNLRKTKPIFVVDFWNDGPMVEGCMAGGRSYLHINAREI